MLLLRLSSRTSSRSTLCKLNVPFLLFFFFALIIITATTLTLLRCSYFCCYCCRSCSGCCCCCCCGSCRCCCCCYLPPRHSPPSKVIHPHLHCPPHFYFTIPMRSASLHYKFPCAAPCMTQYSHTETLGHVSLSFHSMRNSITAPLFFPSTPPSSPIGQCFLHPSHCVFRDKRQMQSPP